MERAEHDLALETAPPPEVDRATARARRERVVALSRDRYARKREEVERELATAREGDSSSRERGKRPPRRFGPPGNRR